MRILQVTYGTNKNLGNYESEKMELIAAVDEHENPDTVVGLLQVAVAEYLGKQPRADQIVSVIGGGNVLTEDGRETNPSTGDKIISDVSMDEKTTKKKKATKKVTKKKAKAVHKSADKNGPDNGVSGKSADTDEGREDTSGQGRLESDEIAEVPPVIAYTADQVKEGLVAVWKKKGKAVAQDILASFEVTKSSELEEEQYAEVMVEVEKCLK